MAEIAGCHGCGNAQWDADGCTCKIDGLLVGNPTKGCTYRIYEEEPEMVSEDYERGFKDGLKSECLEELKPLIAELIEGCTEAIKGITPMLIENARLTIKHNKDSWIPCSERLPEDRDKVLTYDVDKQVRKCEYDAEFKKFRPEFSNYYAMDTSYVTHWMPLPGPPKEE